MKYPRLKNASSLVEYPLAVALHTASEPAVKDQVKAVVRSIVRDTAGPLAGSRLRYEVAKRAIDRIGAAVGLVLLFPVLALIAVSVLLSSGRPVLIRQRRVGRFERPFWLYKFRTLPVTELECSDFRWCVPEPKSWSGVVRSLGLDELPQLWNVLCGHMSLVGPRPERPYFVKQFRDRWPAYAERHSFHVGITGWAQVHGLRGNTSIPARLELDVYYLRNWSLRLDLLILWLTARGFFRAVLNLRLRGRGGPDG